MTLRAICGGVLEPALCRIGCFLFITFFIWTMITVTRKHFPIFALPAQVFSVFPVITAFPGVVPSEAWISCSLSGEACGSAGLAPATALRVASLAPRFALR